MSVAVAVVHGEIPEVFVAEDMDVLHWVLALRWVARADPSSMSPGTRDALREDLLAEQWADAVVTYMDHIGTVVDVYAQHDFYTEARIGMGPQELQFTPLFRDDPGS